MLVDLNGNPQPAIGIQSHWTMLHAVMSDLAIFAPLQTSITQLVAKAIGLNPLRPYINSREAGASTLEAIGSTWHAQFPRRFSTFPNGAARGVFGMALWNHIATLPDMWCFASDADPYGACQSSTNYWRLSPKPYGSQCHNRASKR